MKPISRMLLFIFCALAACAGHYRGKPFSEGRPQIIPGRIQCEWYNLGGAGKAYHDADTVNNGSGRLNPPDGTFLHEFRMNEGVDISYTKSNGIDDNGFNFVKPEMNSLYVGWTEPGEWLNYTVAVEKDGIYQVGLMYTSNRGGQISFSVDGRGMTGPLNVQSTYVAVDTLSWRQWHHWNYADSLATIALKKGIHVLTLHTLAEGNMNYDYLDFTFIR